MTLQIASNIYMFLSPDSEANLPIHQKQTKPQRPLLRWIRAKPAIVDSVA